METKKKTFMDRFLNFVETVGNALPDPASLFIILALITLVLSAKYGSFCRSPWYGKNHQGPQSYDS